MGDKGGRGGLKRFRKLVDRYRITNGKGFRLADHDPRDTGGFRADRKEAAGDLLTEARERLSIAQDQLFAQNRWALLVVIQALDAAGKDSTIKHVMSGVNPQGVDVVSFKQPSTEELDHDYLWRCAKRLPERGRIGIFNRSYYEEVLIVRVHEAILKAQHLPPECVHKHIFKDRLEDMAWFERYLVRNGTKVIKCFLHVSKAEQRRRFLRRLDHPEKNWKFSLGDAKEREYWKDYMQAYEEAIQTTAQEEAPWIIVPADHKWYAQAVVSAAIVVALRDLDVQYPEIDKSQRAGIAAARRLLEKSR